MPETPEKATVVTASPKSSPSKKEIDAATMALNHFAQGKRHLVVGDISSAVNSLQEACKLLADQYGETAPECGDAYFCYGKALLEMARMESGVIGNALDGVPEGDDADNSQVENPEKLTDTEKGEVTELVGNALEENFENLEEKSKVTKAKEAEKSSGIPCNGEKTNGEVVNGEVALENKDHTSQDHLNEKNSSKELTPSAEGESEKQEGSTENEDEDSEADAESQEGDSQDGEGEGEGEGSDKADNKNDDKKEEIEGDQTEEDEEEVSNLQLSWEMLELAKVIFQKQAESDTKKKAKVGEVYLKLGEVGLESENYAQGIDDFKQCLEIQKNVLNSDDRCLAETNYQLGIAYSFCDEFDLAIENFKSAVNVLETRIVNLNQMKKEKEAWTEEQRIKDAATRVDPFYTEQGEIDELNQLLPEMKEKIVDMEQMKKDSKDRIKAAKDAMMSVMGGESSQGSSSSAFGAPSSAFGAPSSAFGAASSAFGAPSTSTSSSSKPAKPIMVVRKKRKLDEEVGGEDSKKVKAESGISIAAVNGSKMANGQAENGSTERTKEEMKEKPSEGKKVELKSVS